MIRQELLSNSGKSYYQKRGNIGYRFSHLEKFSVRFDQLHQRSFKNALIPQNIVHRYNGQKQPPEVFLEKRVLQLYWNCTSAWVFSCKSIADIPNCGHAMNRGKNGKNSGIYFWLTPNSGHLSIMDKFFKTRRCPLFRGFTVFSEHLFLGAPLKGCF